MGLKCVHEPRKQNANLLEGFFFFKKIPWDDFPAEAEGVYPTPCTWALLTVQPPSDLPSVRTECLQQVAIELSGGSL